MHLPEMLDVVKKLQRTEEAENSERDELGRWETCCLKDRKGDEELEPVLDKSLELFRKDLWNRYGKLKWEPIWPEGRPFAVCLTHDADHVNSFSVREDLRRSFFGNHMGNCVMKTPAFPIARIVKAMLKSLAGFKDPVWGYDKWLKVEDRFGFKSTINFFAERVARRHQVDCFYAFSDRLMFDNRYVSVREMIREIEKAGWDIGIHGSYYSAIEPGMLKEQKRQIEELLDKEISSTRQHYLLYDIMKTPGIHSEAEIKTDSTHGFNRSIGFRAGTSYPYLVWDMSRNETSSVLEIPLHIQDGALFSPNGMGYQNIDDAVGACVELMDKVEAVSGCLTLLWHPISFSNNVRWKTYEILLEEAKRRNAWGCSMSELNSWWELRINKIMGVRDSNL